jgi:DNA-binding LacI/PurR family transcriptional regulator
MTDVARLAGVSHQTVSRVLNKRPGVRPGTRARVLGAIDQLGYRLNTAARALVTGRSQTLGVVSLSTTLYGPASTLHGIERAVRDSPYFVSIASVREIDRPSILEAVSRLVDQSVEGIIVIAPLASAADALSDLPTDLPAVLVEGDAEVGLGVVTIDQPAGASAAVEHLLAAGHSTVWHVAGPPDWLEARGRVAGWRAALQAAGAEVPPVVTGDWTARSGYEAGQMLARMPEVTAVFAANDPMALGLLQAFREHGRRVPEDISVVGFDDVPDAAFYYPALTTIRQDFGEVGRRSLGLLLEQIESGSRSADRIVIGSQLVVRATTRPVSP